MYRHHRDRDRHRHQTGTSTGTSGSGSFGDGAFLQSSSLIFVSEIGDKTFFIAALLAARTQRLEELRLGRNPLGDAGVTGLSNGLVCTSTLRIQPLASLFATAHRAATKLYRWGTARPG